MLSSPGTKGLKSQRKKTVPLRQNNTKESAIGSNFEARKVDCTTVGVVGTVCDAKTTATQRDKQEAVLMFGSGASLLQTCSTAATRRLVECGKRSDDHFSASCDDNLARS